MIDSDQSGLRMLSRDWVGPIRLRRLSRDWVGPICRLRRLSRDWV